jgi:hypothetical protein
MVEIGALLFGLALAGIGLTGVRHARWISRLSEQIDAIGSTTTWDEVEPAAWKVSLNRVLFGFVALLGVVFVVGGLLS